MNNNRVCIRFVTSWATKPEEVEQLIHILGQL
jgi:threonine aldolase